MKQPNIIIQMFFCAMLVFATWEGLKYEHRQNTYSNEQRAHMDAFIEREYAQTVTEYGNIPRLSVDDLEYFNPKP